MGGSSGNEGGKTSGARGGGGGDQEDGGGDVELMDGDVEGAGDEDTRMGGGVSAMASPRKVGEEDPINDKEMKKEKGSHEYSEDPNTTDDEEESSTSSFDEWRFS